MPPAARPTDRVSHKLPPMLVPGPGSMDVSVGFLPAWRAIPAAAAAGLQAAKDASDEVIATAEKATKAATGTPGYAAAKAAEEAAKIAAASAMAGAISAAGGGADKHACVEPLPTPPHGVGIVIKGSATVLINNLPAARKGDKLLEPVGPPNTIESGKDSVIIGDDGGGGGGGGGGGSSPGPSAGTDQGETMRSAYGAGSPFCEWCRDN